MKIEFISSSLAQLPTPALAVTGFEGSPASSGTAELLPPETRSLLEELKASGELTGKALETTLLHRPAGLAAKKLLIVGAGKKEKVSTDLMRRDRKSTRLNSSHTVISYAVFCLKKKKKKKNKNNNEHDK